MLIDLKSLNDDTLLKSTLAAADSERAATARLLHHLCEIQRRRLFAKVGHASLFEYCVKALRMSEPQAARRVNAARLLREFPELEEKLSSGTLTLTAASQAQVLFKKETFDREKKKEVLGKIENQSSRNTEKILAEVASVKRVDDCITDLKFLADEETMKNLERLKEIWSHEMPNASLADLIKKMAEYCRKSLDPLEKAKRAKEKRQRTAPPAPEFSGRTRYIPARVRHAVWHRDGGSCTFVNERGRRCGSRHKLQLDHILPYGKGGQNTVENLRLRCFAHNQWHAIQSYGERVLKWTGDSLIKSGTCVPEPSRLICKPNAP